MKPLAYGFSVVFWIVLLYIVWQPLSLVLSGAGLHLLFFFTTALLAAFLTVRYMDNST